MLIGASGKNQTVWFPQIRFQRFSNGFQRFSQIFKWFSKIFRNAPPPIPQNPWKSYENPWKSLKIPENLWKSPNIFGVGMRERQKRRGPEAKLCCNQEKTISENLWKPSENLWKSLKILPHFKPKSEKNFQNLWRYILFSNGFSLNIKH